MQKFVLEKQKFFPLVAWVCVFGFAAFTFTLAVELTEATEKLDVRTQQTVSAVKGEL